MDNQNDNFYIIGILGFVEVIFSVVILLPSYLLCQKDLSCMVKTPFWSGVLCFASGILGIAVCLSKKRLVIMVNAAANIMTILGLLIARVINTIQAKSMKPGTSSTLIYLGYAVFGFSFTVTIIACKIGVSALRNIPPGSSTEASVELPETNAYRRFKNVV
ncbi:uncharacterized protein LOC100211947 isoform X1 [Hydra vulgaris]|uniref:uncharacterized protein LOC100211947 isoform X1 n=1 Tax=Hydra vulgaris TaxID=6087 RepID=UPI001F5E72E1|nr:uncharacterized protein LOC100211947 isoform X1 [Hydra vulgaris]